MQIIRISFLSHHILLELVLQWTWLHCYGKWNHHVLSLVLLPKMWESCCCNRNFHLLSLVLLPKMWESCCCNRNFHLLSLGLLLRMWESCRGNRNFYLLSLVLLPRMWGSWSRKGNHPLLSHLERCLESFQILNRICLFRLLFSYVYSAFHITHCPYLFFSELDCIVTAIEITTYFLWCSF